MNIKSDVKNIKQNSIVADIAIDFLPEIETPNTWNILDRYYQSGFHFLNIALGGELTSLDTAIHFISRIRSKLQKDIRFIIVKTGDDILRAKKENKLGLGFWFQGITPLANDINLIEAFYL
ncbi:MAG: membrane dipeptidase [Legionella sp.]|nr:membrane dipeptidase [Legionella sp.]